MRITSHAVRNLTGIVLFAVWGSAPGGELTLVRDGRAVSTIVLAEQPTRAAQLAAFELQHHIRLITGAEVAVACEPAPADGTRILVGASSAAAALGVSAEAFDTQEYMIRFAVDTLVLAGRDKRDTGEVAYSESDPFAFRTWPSLFDEQGTLHAVYDFLERFCGVRWFAPTEVGMDCPRAKTLTVTGSDVRRAPAFSYRDCGWAMTMSENYDAVTSLWPRDSEELTAYESAAYAALHKRFPNPWQYIHAKRGRVRLFLHRMRMGGEQYQANHSFYGYYERFWEKSEKTPDLFAAKKPEWFAQGYDGKPPQMCYTSPGFIRQVVQDARDTFDGKGTPHRAVAFGDNFALVPMDNSSYCTCERCQALRNPQEEHNPFFSNGLWSDYVFGFANDVAREITESHPGKVLATLAYSTYAKYPERIRLEDNIAVQLCLHVRNVYDTAMQENDLSIFQSWVSKERNRPIYLWLYYCFPVERGHRDGGWHVFPGFFAHQIDKSFKMYHRHGVRGAFFNGFGQDVDAYMTFECLDDPTRNADALLDEYFTRYFGAAAEPMRAFYLMVEDVYCDPRNYPTREKDGKLLPVGHQTEELAWLHLGTAERMAMLGGFVEKARALVKTDTEKRRLALFEKGVWDYMRRGPVRVESIDRPDCPDTPAQIERLLARAPEMANDDAAQGKPFVLETPGSLFSWRGKMTHHRHGELPGWTDGDTTETCYLFDSKAKEISARCELGPVPAEGRELREIRIAWSLADSLRSRINVKFAVRDVATQEWRDATGYLTQDKWEQAKAGSYKVLTVPFAHGTITGFDAVRVTDGAPLLGFNPSRFTEIDVVTTNAGNGPAD